ncbi:flagellar hook-associated protein FlgK [bacterium]|nr:flagellar hook-associated protein FlgK [bacterium]
MVSTFFGFTISMKALMAAQKGLEVTAHNIANANTPGYSRQRPELVAGRPIVYPGMNRPGSVPLQLGTGVNVRSIERMRDVYLDHIIRNSTSDSGWFAAKETGFSKLEVTLNEPSESGLSSVITELFNAFADLSNQPELNSERANVREKGINLAETFNMIDSELKSLRADQNRSIIMGVNEINNILHQISDINVQIITIEGIGDKANDLKDARDLLIEQLSAFVNIDTIERDHGEVAVLISGMAVVDKEHVVELATETKLDSSYGNVDVYFENGVRPRITAGELKGFLEMRDETIPAYQDKLNRCASALVNRINHQHRLGYGMDGKSGRSFFRDYNTASLTGTIAFPPGTTLDTPIDELGITSGKFYVQHTEIEITPKDVKPAEAITVGELLEKINQAQPYVRASLVDDYTGIRVQLDLYNPPDVSETIHTHEGSSNFLTAITGVTDAEVVTTETARAYTNAMDMISISLALQDNLDIIAAASEDEFGMYSGAGDNSNALNIAELNDSMNAVEGSSFMDYYNSIIGELGSQAQANYRLTANQEMLLSQLDNQRAQISGVSIDEESLNMIQYQRAFEGAARVSSTLDSMIETIIFGLGSG